MRMDEFYKKTTNYWQAVLRVGLPIISFYRATQYVIFYVERGKSVGLHYPWRFSIIMDLITIFVLSTLWWSLMRSVFRKHSSTGGTNETQSVE